MLNAARDIFRGKRTVPLLSGDVNEVMRAMHLLLGRPLETCPGPLKSLLSQIVMRDGSHKIVVDLPVPNSLLSALIVASHNKREFPEIFKQGPATLKPSCLIDIETVWPASLSATGNTVRAGVLTNTRILTGFQNTGDSPSLNGLSIAKKMYMSVDPVLPSLPPAPKDGKRAAARFKLHANRGKNGTRGTVSANLAIGADLQTIAQISRGAFGRL